MQKKKNSKKEETVSVDFVTTDGKKFCTCKFKKSEWDEITQLALNRFVNEALRAALDEAANNNPS